MHNIGIFETSIFVSRGAYKYHRLFIVLSSVMLGLEADQRMADAEANFWVVCEFLFTFAFTLEAAMLIGAGPKEYFTSFERLVQGKLV